ncbi:MAG: nucleotide exchange factor GrpE [Candidatus Magasanikbacteria bacterium]|nr:nucleotide exchange factor GrpE [Candidatus Magasanikbacteria bacterium]
MSDEPNQQLIKPDEQAVASEAVSAEPPTDLEKQCAEYKLGWQRAVADYQNLQKETAARRAEWAQMSEQQILEDFIPVYDNFKKAFAHHHDVTSDMRQLRNWIDGISHIMKQFGEVLKAHNVQEIKALGEKFDPKFHETVGEEKAEKEAGLILREVDGGYIMGGRVIKVAKVIIAK